MNLLGKYAKEEKEEEKENRDCRLKRKTFSFRLELKSADEFGRGG
jgi:hypothetical protein